MPGDAGRPSVDVRSTRPTKPDFNRRIDHLFYHTLTPRGTDAPHFFQIPHAFVSRFSVRSGAGAGGLQSRHANASGQAYSRRHHPPAARPAAGGRDHFTGAGPGTTAGRAHPDRIRSANGCGQHRCRVCDRAANAGRDSGEWPSADLHASQTTGARGILPVRRQQHSHRAERQETGRAGVDAFHHGRLSGR